MRLERLTSRQKEVFDVILHYKGDISVAKIGRLCGRVSRQAIADRLDWIIRKGYLKKDGDKYIPTADGLDKIIKDGGRTKHSYYESTANWEKTLRPDGFSKAAETQPQPE